jgi:lysyl-tRNA synthetase class 2
MSENDYLEVETPMMHSIPGGTTAKPFITHHNSLGIDLFLRIAPELYLKRLIVGGFTKVFELNRSFRNEGLSTRHNPEFTMMEWYCAYSDYQSLMAFTEKTLKQLVKTFSPNQIFQQLDFDAPFQRLTMKQALLRENTWLTAQDLTDLSKLLELVHNHLPDFPKVSNLGEALMALFEVTVESKLIQPTFITEFPIEVSPLARRNNQDPSIADRFELYIGGFEIGNGYSELNDPQDQA